VTGEQRRPYFLAKAGNALACWLAPRIRKTNAKAAARTEVPAAVSAEMRLRPHYACCTPQTDSQNSRNSNSTTRKRRKPSNDQG